MIVFDFDSSKIGSALDTPETHFVDSSQLTSLETSKFSGIKRGIYPGNDKYFEENSSLNDAVVISYFRAREIELYLNELGNNVTLEKSNEVANILHSNYETFGLLKELFVLISDKSKYPVKKIIISSIEDDGEVGEFINIEFQVDLPIYDVLVIDDSFKEVNPQLLKNENLRFYFIHDGI